jgi:DNA-directed RNA polymerase specialized sigma24 family protein
MDAATRRELRNADWFDIALRLAAHATWRARNLRWRTGLSCDLAAGKTPEDIAAEAILKVMEGARVWDPKRGALLPFLQGVVDSLLSHLASSADNRAQERWAATYSAAAAIPEPDSISPEERLAELRRLLVENRRPELLAIIDAIGEGCEPKPQVIARRLGTTIADVNNRLKRLRRLALKINQAQRVRAMVG